MGKKQKSDLALLNIIPGLKMPQHFQAVIDELYEQYRGEGYLDECPEKYRQAHTVSSEKSDMFRSLLPKEHHKLFIEVSDSYSYITLLTEEIYFAKGVMAGIMLASTQSKINDLCNLEPIQNSGRKGKPGPSAA